VGGQDAKLEFFVRLRFIKGLPITPASQQAIRPASQPATASQQPAASSQTASQPASQPSSQPAGQPASRAGWGMTLQKHIPGQGPKYVNWAISKKKSEQYHVFFLGP
jgi:hypothetical protein